LLAFASKGLLGSALCRKIIRFGKIDLPYWAEWGIFTVFSYSFKKVKNFQGGCNIFVTGSSS